MLVGRNGVWRRIAMQGVRAGAIVLAAVVAAALMPALAVGAGRSVSSADALVGRGELSGVSCVSVGACIAVGETKNGAGTQVTLAERWNGRRWTIQATPNPPGALSADLSGVSCVSAECTAVGEDKNRAGDTVTLVERWNGRRWGIQASPNLSRDGFPSGHLYGVSCEAMDACIAVGDGTGASGTLATLAERWDGTSWTIPAAPNPAAGAQASHLTSQLFGASCVSSGACTAVGVDENSGAGVDEGLGGPELTLAERWDGTSWTIQSIPDPASDLGNVDLTGVSCVTAGACTAVGDSTNGGGAQATLAERWDGTSWTIQATPNPAGDRRSPTTGFNGVSCVSADACTAVGAHTNRAGTFVTLAERWNGRRWTIQAIPGAQDSGLNGVSCASAHACVAVGSGHDRAGTEVTLAERWNGRRWTIQATPPT
jgi:hypothetical protein